jgi:hypothetical protein
VHTGCKHYRTDLGPNYTVILGSHRNRRLKMLVDGQTVVDMAGIVLCPSSFERYWISILDGRITVDLRVAMAETDVPHETDVFPQHHEQRQQRQSFVFSGRCASRSCSASSLALSLHVSSSVIFPPSTVVATRSATHRYANFQ